MNSCYLCDEKFISDNISSEHILLNSIGGRLKSKNLLCKNCNSKLGNQSDSELAKQLSFIAGYLNIKRERGSLPIIKGAKSKDGTEYHLVDGSKPIMSKPTIKIENGKYYASARTEKELDNIVKGLHKNDPSFDISEIKKNYQWQEEYLNEFLSNELAIGGSTAFRSILKTAINFYIYKSEEKSQVEHLFKHLESQEELDLCKHYYPDKPIYKKESNEVVHLIHICGNKHKKTLFCIIEFFSSFSFIVELSKNYTGKNINFTYCYDVLKNKELSKSVNAKLESFQFDKHKKLSITDFEKIKVKLDRVMKIGNKIQVDKEISNISKKTVTKVFEKYKNEPVVTEEMIRELSEEVALAYVRFTMRNKN